jgi:hypothetical protein
MKMLGKFGCMLTLSLAASLMAAGQRYPQNPPGGTPPTFPEGTKQNPDQTQPQNPGQNPDQTSPTARNTAPPPSSLTRTQTQIEDAIRQQMPSSADKVSVGITNDDRIQLSGNVDSEREKRQIEQIAQSAAPDANIINSITVGQSSPHGTPPQS